MSNQIESLLRTIIEPLIEEKDQFEIKKVETDDFMEYHLILAPSDIGRVIGRRGRVIRSIRTILYSVRHRGEKRIRIVVNDD